MIVIAIFFQLAWAPGRGVKSPTFRSFWNLEEGVSFVPWDKIKQEEELVELGDGSWIDPSTCPPGMSPPVTHQGKQAPWHGEIFMHRSSYIKCIWMAYHKPMCNSPLECQQEKICCMHVKSVYLLWLLQMI